MITSLIAQCVMCSRTAAAQQGGRSAVFNSGILILLAAPLAVLLTLAFLVWRRELDRRRTPQKVEDGAQPLTRV